MGVQRSTYDGLFHAWHPPVPIEALLRLGVTYIDSSDALVSTCAGREVAALSVVDRRLGCEPVPGLPRLPNLFSAIKVSMLRYNTTLLH